MALGGGLWALNGSMDVRKRKRERKKLSQENMPAHSPTPQSTAEWVSKLIFLGLLPLPIHVVPKGRLENEWVLLSSPPHPLFGGSVFGERPRGMESRQGRLLVGTVSTISLFSFLRHEILARAKVMRLGGWWSEPEENYAVQRRTSLLVPYYVTLFSPLPPGFFVPRKGRQGDRKTALQLNPTQRNEDVLVRPVAKSPGEDRGERGGKEDEILGLLPPIPKSEPLCP